jgi:hypothetical protein
VLVASTMLQAHSFLWHYLWAGPNLLLLSLGVFAIWRRIHKEFPFFVAFCFIAPLEQLTVYAADVSPWVTAENFWRVFLAGLVTEGLLKIFLLGEIFGHVFGSYASVAQFGKRVIRAVAAILLLCAIAGAAYVRRDNSHWLISGSHLIEQTIFIVESGLLLFIFLFASHFRIRWKSRSFGIAVGLGISSCVHLATWAVMANGGMLDKRYILDFINMATYQLCVLIWFYYLILPQKKPTTSTVSLPENNLAVWNRELERLLQ